MLALSHVHLYHCWWTEAVNWYSWRCEGRLFLSIKVVFILLFYSYFLKESIFFHCEFPIFLNNHATGHPVENHKCKCKGSGITAGSSRYATARYYQGYFGSEGLGRHCSFTCQTQMIKILLYGNSMCSLSVSLQKWLCSRKPETLLYFHTN